MKPRNKFQELVYEASKKLPRITKVQKEWAFQNCFEHTGRRTAKGVISCPECGHQWQGCGELIDNLLGAQCPECSAKLKVMTTRKRVFRQTEYFCLVTSCEGFQVLRFYLVKACFKAGETAQYSIIEVVQRWIAPGGKYATVARLRHASFYCDLWNTSSSLEIRPENELYNINPIRIYPHQKVIPELKRSGYKGECYGINHFDLFCNLLSDNRSETLLKAGQTKVLKFFAGSSFNKINDYWASIKICMRNRYYIEDVSVWKDYIDLLRFFGKDLHNAKYVCPADLTAEHDRYVTLKNEYHKKQKEEQARRKALEDEAIFDEMKSRFFGIQFADGVIQVRMLESVTEIMQEGNAMHHCVFANEYHLRPDSLILSARMNGKRLETVEFSLSKMQVVQSRGACNQTTEYHDRIIKLVSKNRKLIQQRMTA